MLKIYCERSWIILENIEIIFFEKIQLKCVQAVVLSVSIMILVLHM